MKIGLVKITVQNIWYLSDKFIDAITTENLLRMIDVLNDPSGVSNHDSLRRLFNSGG